MSPKKSVECQRRRLVRNRRWDLLGDLVRLDPLILEEDKGVEYLVCFFCAEECAADAEGDLDHADDCVWDRARRETAMICAGREAAKSPPNQGRRGRRKARTPKQAPKKPRPPLGGNEVTMPTTSLAEDGEGYSG